MKNKTILFTIALAIISLSIIHSVSATIFDKEIPCTSRWYCSAYSQNDCGSKICIDVNGCNSNFNQPIDFVECQNASVESNNVSSEGHFTVSNNIIRLTVEQEKVIQKIISVNSSSLEDFTLEIEYPSSYTKGTDLFTTSSNNKHMTKGDFNIIIDTRSIFVGTYVIPIKIYNKYYSRSILAVVDVVPKNNPDIKLEINFPEKTLNVDKELTSELDVKDAKLQLGDNLTYEIIDPFGNIITQQDKTVEDTSKITDTITLPLDVVEGYYTLSVNIESASGTYAKNSIFTILAPNKYFLIKESKPKIHYATIFIVSIIIIIGLIVAAMNNTTLFYKQHKFNRRYKYSRGITMFKISLGRPNIKINLGTGDTWRKFKDKMHLVISSKPIIDSNKRADLLKKTFERGFITIAEYRDAIKNQGYTIQNEKTQSISKENLKAEEEQKQEMEKTEKTVLKQEEKLKKEIEQETESKKKKREEEELKEKKMEEKEIKEEIKEIKAEIKETQETIVERIEIKTPIEKIERITPMSHIIKENILDKRVGDNQSFTLNSGERLYCLRDLLNTLPHMHEYVFAHHTKHGRNDFANWIGDIFQYNDVAEEVKNSDSREELIRILRQYE